MEQQTIFKSAAFGGFDKKSVLDFIDELTETHHQAEEALRRKINEFSKAQDSQLAHIQQLKGELAQKDEELSALRLKLSQGDAPAEAAAEEPVHTPAIVTSAPADTQLQGENLRLQDEVSRVSAELLQAEETLQTLRADNGRLENALSEAQRENNRLQKALDSAQPDLQKEKDKDELLRKIGDAMVIAKCNADKLVDDAKLQAQKTLEDANRRGSALFEDAKARAGEILRQAKQQELDARADAQRIRDEADAALENCFSAVPLMEYDCKTMQKQVENTLYSLEQRVKDLLVSLQTLESRRTASSDAVPAAGAVPAVVVRGAEEPSPEDYPELSILAKPLPPSEADSEDDSPAESSLNNLYSLITEPPADTMESPPVPVPEAPVSEIKPEEAAPNAPVEATSEPTESDFPDLSALSVPPKEAIAEPAASDFPDLSALSVPPKEAIAEPAEKDFPDLSALNITPKSTPLQGRGSPIEPLPDLDAVLAKFSGNAYGTVTPVVRAKPTNAPAQGLPDGELFGLDQDEAKLLGFTVSK